MSSFCFALFDTPRRAGRGAQRVNDIRKRTPRKRPCDTISYIVSSHGIPDETRKERDGRKKAAAEITQRTLQSLVPATMGTELSRRAHGANASGKTSVCSSTEFVNETNRFAIYLIVFCSTASTNKYY